jgi:hypothetical protein
VLGALSADGGTVVLESRASNLVAGDRNGRRRDVFSWDRATGEMVLVSRGRRGGPAHGPSFQPKVSADGRFVVYSSAAGNIGRRDRNGATDVFLWDGAFNRTRVISHARGDRGRAASGQSQDPWISADGRSVVFKSWADNLVRRDRRGGDFFEYRVGTGKVRRIALPRRTVRWPYTWIASPDGRYVAVRPKPSSHSLRVWDRQTDEISGRCAFGFEPGGDGTLSADGRFFTGHVAEVRRDLVGQFFGSCDFSGATPPVTVDYGHVAATPDGANLATNIQTYDGGQRVMDVLVAARGGTGESAFTQRPTSTWNGASSYPGVAVSADARVLAYDAESAAAITGPPPSRRAVYVWDRGPA